MRKYGVRIFYKCMYFYITFSILHCCAAFGWSCCFSFWVAAFCVEYLLSVSFYLSCPIPLVWLSSSCFFEMGANKYRTSWEWERWRKCTPLIVSPMQLWNVFSFSKCKKKFICSACVANWNGIKSREEKRDSAPTLNKNVQHLQL